MLPVERGSSLVFRAHNPLDRRKIQLTDPLKTVGENTVGVRLHREVTAHIKVNVVAEAQEEDTAEEAKAASAVE